MYMNTLHTKFQRRLKDLLDYDASLFLERHKKQTSVFLIGFLLFNVSSGIYLYSTVFGHGGEDHGESITGAHSSQYPIVHVEQAQLVSTAEQSIEVHGEVFATNETDVFPLREGIISELYVNLGDVVKEGDVLATLQADRDQLSLGSEVQQLNAAIDVSKQSVINNKKQFEAQQEQIDTRVSNMDAQIEQASVQVVSALFDFINNLNQLLFTYGGSVKKNSTSLRRKGLLDDESADRIADEVRILADALQGLQEKDTVTQDMNLLQGLMTDALQIGKEIKLLTNKNLLNTGVQNSDISERLEVLSTQIDTLIESSQTFLEIQNEVVQLQAEKKSIELQIETQTLQNDLEVQLKESQRGAISSQLYVGNTITAPFDGVVSERMVSVGDSVGLDKPLFHIVDDKQTFIRFRINESDLPLITVGNEIAFSPSSHPSLTYTAQIARIARSLDRATRTVLVEADITSVDTTAPVLSGMNVRAYIPLTMKNDWWVISEQTIIISGDAQFVWTVDASLTTQKLSIETAFIRDGSAFIKSGITGDEWIVSKSPIDLESGLEVDTTS
jgi:RND family efflux transporter MFP subunit